MQLHCSYSDTNFYSTLVVAMLKMVLKSNLSTFLLSYFQVLWWKVVVL